MEMQETDNQVRKHPLDSPFPRYIAAGFLAVVLHMFFLFFVETPDADGSVSGNIKHVTLLPLDTKLVSEKNLLQWMNIMNPMSVTKPDRKHGYSFVPENKKPKDFNLAMKKHYSQAKKGSFSPISAPVESYRDKVKRFWDYTSAPVRKPSFSIVKRSVGDYPLWVLEDGKILPQLFNKSDNVKSIIAKHKLPTKETVLKVESYGSGFFPRIRIDVSCGNSKLDLLALKTLAIKGQNLLGFNKSNDAPVYIAIKWKISD